MSVDLRYGLALVCVSATFVLAETFVYYRLPQHFNAFALSAFRVHVLVRWHKARYSCGLHRV